MLKKLSGVLIVGILVPVFAATSCRSTPTATALAVRPSPTTPTQPASTSTPTGSSEGVLISELLPGIPGNNNHEFIELYNVGTEPVDLSGWSLWYQLDDNQE